MAGVSVHYVVEVWRPDIDLNWTSAGSPCFLKEEDGVAYMALVRNALPVSVKVRLLKVTRMVVLVDED